MRAMFYATRSQPGELESEISFSKVILGARMMFHASKGTISQKQLSQRSSNFIS
jgi:hypothetical protein